MKSFKTIEIDLPLHKFIEDHRNDFSESGCTILKRCVGLEANKINLRSLEQNGNDEGSLHLEDSVILPSGTKLRKKYKGTFYFADVRDAKIWVNGKSFASPSMAAIVITGYNVNGWIFWEARIPGAESWILLDDLRRKE